ncbi:hypothetical protein SUGI_0952890 [Cryptomeria japonica]|nr:hypothetical protein SUGI_0952890 [Cryptomeria japonica]
MYEMGSAGASSSSNLECFLACITPRMPAHYLPKRRLPEFGSNKWLQPHSEEGCTEYFNAGNMWDLYDEWSAYGAGVPIVLNTGETVVQYYVPYLSALQIYTANDIRSSTNLRNVRDESDGDLELRDSISDSCSDSESGNLSERSSSFRSESCNSSERLGLWDAASEDSSVLDNDSMWHMHDRLGHLCLEYFEQAVPYARVPLMEKVNQLARGFPDLMSLKSTDLSPASWMSVAWYPIYHIPTGRTIRDLSACFLTYHTLSISFQENEIGEGNGRMELGKTKAEDGNYITLPPFGLSTYKLQGSTWTSAGCVDQQRIISLLSSADSWLKQLRVRHPDFEFFNSHNLSLQGKLLLT